MSAGIDPGEAQCERPAFLQRLALDADADARSIRRAYARELKLIDQEHDAVQFQDLRLAYELALAWAEEREAGARHAAAPAAGTAMPVGAVADASNADHDVAAGRETGAQLPAAFEPRHADAPGGDDALEVGAQEFADRAVERFASAGAALLASADADDRGAWIACLEHILADEGMINLAARACFESRIARMLTDGWRPGHEYLFDAACQVFDWTGDHRRLRSLGEAGAFLCSAIDECMIAQAQPPAILAAQAKAAARLRDPRPPTKGEIVDTMQHIEDVIARYPAWLFMISNVANIAMWREASTDVRGWQRTTVPDSGPAHTRAGAAGNWWSLVVAIVMLLNILSRCSSN